MVNFWKVILFVRSTVACKPLSCRFYLFIFVFVFCFLFSEKMLAAIIQFGVELPFFYSYFGSEHTVAWYFQNRKDALHSHKQSHILDMSFAKAGLLSFFFFFVLFFFPCRVSEKWLTLLLKFPADVFGYLLKTVLMRPYILFCLHHRGSRGGMNIHLNRKIYLHVWWHRVPASHALNAQRRVGTSDEIFSPAPTSTPPPRKKKKNAN